MKPRKLIMSAFGSYGGVEEIDFEKVNRGIFLITGDTGAGKTTVFDAITYALFDETSGGRREGDMMRSQFADDATPTYVEFTFSYNGEEYHIKRNPNYRRISKRRNKDGEYTYTMETAAVELTLPDGRVFPGKARETNEKIREILGVDVNQFTQISMIAQGEFLKLLHAPSKERKEIFSRIFDTKIYWQIQNRLKEQSKELYVKLDRNLLLMKHELSGVRCPKADMQMEWEQTAERPETGKQEIFSFLKSMEKTLAEQEKALQKQETECSDGLGQVKLMIAQAEEINQQFTRKENTEKSIADWKEQLQGLRNQIATEEEKRKQLEKVTTERMPELEQQLAKAKNQLPDYEQLGQRRKEANQLEKKKEELKERLAAIEGQEEQLKGETEELQKSQKALQPQLEQLPRLEQQQKELQQRKDELLTLEENCREARQQAKQLELLRQQVAEALKESQERGQEYEQKYHMFIAEQAGILADTLTEGEPCPVCGSTHHPRKAKLSVNAVTQQQVELAKKEREQALEQLERANESFRDQKEQYEGLRQVLLHNGQRLLGEDAVRKGKEYAEKSVDKMEQENVENPMDRMEEALYTILAAAVKECSSTLEQLKKEYANLVTKQNTYRKQEQRLEQINAKQTVLQQERELLKEKVYEASLTHEKAMQSVKEMQEKMEYPSIEELKKHMEKLQQEKEQLSGELQKVTLGLQAKQQQAARAEGTLEEQQKQLELLINTLKEKETVDITSFRQREQELLVVKKEAEEKRLALLAVKDGNRKAKKQLEELYRQREALLEKYEVADTLSRTANGNLRQQARLDLQTYVQRRYFKHMIGEANRRLVEMSNGKFILQCRKREQLAKQGEAGLDLDVYDMVTDKVRDVKTLSGGESFLAALSMALGMADVIQKNAGKVHLDTMFIDEGFGSLDEDARGKAIQILQELAGETRLVGIISHVTEMKEQMDRKLVITKSDKGSHAQWQLED